HTLSNATVLPNRAANPLEGARTADEFIENTSSGVHSIAFPGFSGRVANEPFTVSVFLKKNSGPKSTVRVAPWSSYAYADVDLTTGAVSNLYRHSTYIPTFTLTTQDMGDGWWRVVATLTAATPQVGTNCDPKIYMMNGANNSYVGDGTSGFFLFGLLYVNGAKADPIYVKSGETPHATGGRVTGPASIAPAIIGPTKHAFGSAQGALFLDVRGVLYRSDDGLTYDYVRWLAENPDGETSYGLLDPLWVGEDHLGRLAVVESGGNRLSLLDGDGRVVATSAAVVVGTNYQYVQASADRRHLWAVNKSGARHIYKFDLETLTHPNIDLYYFFQTSTTGLWHPNVRQIAVDDTYLYAVFSFSNDADARELWRVPLASLVTTTSGGPQGQGAAMGWVRLIDLGVDPDAMACGNGVLVIAHDNDLFYSDDGGATIERATVSEIVTPGFHTITSLQYEATTATWLACGKHFMAVSGDGKTWQRAETEPDISYGAGGIVGGLAVAFDTETGRGGRMFELVDNTTEVLVPTMPHATRGLAYYMKGR
ncbi:MAG: hypothetical protein H5T76_24565, partial [Streptomyces sp.]|nr:hypothetical protein [Streptomyces sp.]